LKNSSRDHPSWEQAIQRRNLCKELLFLGTLKLQRQLINAALNLRTRELCRQYEVDRHLRCYRSTEPKGQ